METRHVSCCPGARPPKRPHRECTETVHPGQWTTSRGHGGPAGDEDGPSWPDLFATVSARTEPPARAAVFDANDLGAVVGRVSSTYCASFSSPRWVDVKGVDLPCHEQVRMKNALWREWHLQLTLRHRPSLCPLPVALDDPVYLRALSVVPEGHCWRRPLTAVRAEYRRRRVFWVQRRGWQRRGSCDSRMDSTDESVSDGCGQVVPGAVNLVGETSDSECSPCLGIDDDAFIAELLQSACMGTQRQDADEQQKSACQDTDPVALIEDLLRNDGTDWRRVGVVGDPARSVQDAFDGLTKAGCQRQQPVQPSPSAPRDQPRWGRERSCSVDMSCEDELFHKAPRRQSQGDSPHPIPRVDGHDRSFQVAAPPRPESSREATPTSSRGCLKAPQANDPGTNGSDLDVLRRLVPSLRDSGKPTQVTILEQSALYCRQLREEHKQLDDQLAQLRMQVALQRQQTIIAQNEIPNQTALREQLRRDTFRAWVEAYSSRNCKFCLFALLVAPLYPSFMASVSVTSEDDLRRTTAEWLHKHCSLAAFRHSVLNSLTLLCKSTSVLASPDKLPQELIDKAKSTWTLEDTNAAQ